MKALNEPQRVGRIQTMARDVGTDRRKTRKLAYVNQRKLDRGCRVCGFGGHQAALRFAGVSRTPERLALDDASYDRINKVIDRSHVECENCYRIRKYEERKARASA